MLFKANDDLFRLVRQEGSGDRLQGPGGRRIYLCHIGDGIVRRLRYGDRSGHDAQGRRLSSGGPQHRRDPGTLPHISPRKLRERILKIYNEDWDLPNVYEGARASAVGKIVTHDRFLAKHKGQIVCDVPIKHLTGGIRYQREEKPRAMSLAEPVVDMPVDMNAVMLKILGSPNIASREHIYRYYDTEVMGNTVIRPGEADAGLIAPVRGEKFGVALAVDSNPFYGRINPYWGGATSVAECLRNVAAIGATPAAITDCLNFGNPEKPEAFWEFREAVKGLSEACKKLWLKGYVNQPIPIVSGNVSFYNECPSGSVDPSPVVACVGTMKDADKAVTMELKAAGDKLFLIGPRYDELGGSEYYKTIFGATGANVPIVRFELERSMIYAVIDAIDQGLVAACHDISNGGLAATLSEMALTRPAELGLEVDLINAGDPGMRTDKIMFSESSGFVIEAKARSEAKLAEIIKIYGLEIMEIGSVTKARRILMRRNGSEVVDLDLDEARKVWVEGLAEAMR